jgi:5-formyltetrahydrofolate cyclo-ligase
MMASSSLKSSKKALRKAIGTALSALPALAVETQSRDMTARVLSSAFFQECNTVSCYLSMPGEADTSSVVSETLRAGKTLFVPKIDQTEGRMVFLGVYDEDDLETLPSGVWGIKEPADYWAGRKRQNGVLFSNPIAGLARTIA